MVDWWTLTLHADLGTHSAHCAADRGLSQVQFFGVLWMRLLLCNDRCRWSLRQRLGAAQCLVRLWIHVLHLPGWLLEEFYDFLPARRRQRQWHVPHGCCWFDAPRAMFPRLLAGFRLMLQLLASCTWKYVHYLPLASYIFSIFHVRNFARVYFFLSPRALTGVSARGLGVGADAGSSLSGVGPPVVHN